MPIILSKTEADAVEKLLIANYSELKQELKRLGQWYIPNSVISKLKLLKGLDKIDNPNELNLIRGENKVIDDSVKLFKSSPLLVDKFCLLKIKEIRYFLRGHHLSRPTTKITISILEHETNINTASVMLVSVQFDKNGMAKTIESKVDRKQYPNTLTAIKLSYWSIDYPRETMIRFSDRHIEDKLSIKLYCEKIPYALASDNVKDGTDQTKNFWEVFAYQYQNDKLLPELSYIPMLADDMKKIKTHVNKITLDNDIQAIAEFRKDCEQTKYIIKILQNQNIGLGTLLYLPTGKGKTFIMILAMAQHYRKLAKTERKPYLVVVPAVNVMQAWLDNIALLKIQFPNLKKLFGEKFSYLKIKDGNELIKYLSTIDQPNAKKYQIVIITETLLLNYVKNLFVEVDKKLIDK